jgi:hypothetical protein
VTKAFQWLHQVSLQAVCVEPVEVVDPQICIGAMPLLEVISDHQNAVSDSDAGALPPSPSGKSLKLGGQIRVLGASGCPGGLARHATQPWTTFTNLVADPLAGTLVVSRTHSCQLARWAEVGN